MKITIIGAGAMGGAMAEGLLLSEKFIPFRAYLHLRYT